MEYSSALHYKRGIYIIDKIIDTISKGNDAQAMNSLLLWLHQRAIGSNHALGIYDINNFLLCVSTTLMGLNKESMEKSSNFKNYKYKIKYRTFDDYYNENKRIWYGDKKLTLQEELFLKKMVKQSYDLTFPDLEDQRILTTDFDDWLCITGMNSLPSFDYNFIFNVRNAFMHSSYVPIYNKEHHNFYLVDVQNDNYTKFRGLINYTSFSEFIKFYFGNTIHFGLMDNVCFFEKHSQDGIHSKEELLKVLSELRYTKICLENKSLDQGSIYEKDLLRELHKNDGAILMSKLDEMPLQKEIHTLSDEEITKVMLFVKKDLGDKFYELSDKEQTQVLYAYVKAMVDPKHFLNDAIFYFFGLIRGCVINPAQYEGEHTNSVDLAFSEIPALLLIKSYMILYRLQSKYLEEIDFNLLSDVDFTYEEDNLYKYDIYNHFKDKLTKKGIIVSDKEYQKRYFCEIIRDALAHGNISLDIASKGDDISYNLIFSDEYKGKKRKITISMEEYQKFLSSEAFDPKYCQAKDMDKPLSR